MLLVCRGIKLYKRIDTFQGISLGGFLLLIYIYLKELGLIIVKVYKKTVYSSQFIFCLIFQMTVNVLLITA